MVYCASALSLAALELFVHLDPDDWPEDFVSIRAELPDDLVREVVDPQSLPAGWNKVPGPVDLQDRGTTWANSSKSVALIVPSAVISGERNVLFNPRHADMARVLRHPHEPFSFDPRMRK
jgi:RES domain-containing protein